MRTTFLAAGVAILIGCGDDDAAAKTSKEPVADPCVAIRARLYARMSEDDLVGFSAGSTGIIAKADYDAFKLAHPTCFF